MPRCLSGRSRAALLLATTCASLAACGGPELPVTRTWITERRDAGSCGDRMTRWEHLDAAGHVRRRYCEDALGRLQAVEETFLGDGQPLARATWLKGRREGPAVSWYDNGQRRAEGTHHDGTEHGVWQWWRRDGSKAGEAAWRHGTLDGWTLQWNAAGIFTEATCYHYGRALGRTHEERRARATPCPPATDWPPDPPTAPTVPAVPTAPAANDRSTTSARADRG